MQMPPFSRGLGRYCWRLNEQSNAVVALTVDVLITC